jgi:hypothetical protein
MARQRDKPESMRFGATRVDVADYQIHICMRAWYMSTDHQGKG